MQITNFPTMPPQAMHERRAAYPRPGATIRQGLRFYAEISPVEAGKAIADYVIRHIESQFDTMRRQQEASPLT